MVTRILLTAVCSLLFGSIAHGQTSLGALRLSGGGASAGGGAGAYAYDYAAYPYAYYVIYTAGPYFGDTRADATAAASMTVGGSHAQETIAVTALVHPATNQTAYVPQVAVGVSHLVSANVTGDYAYAFTGYLQPVYFYGYFGTSGGHAAATFSIDDAAADCPCLTGFIDTIVATGRNPGWPWSDAGSFVDAVVDRAEFRTAGTIGGNLATWTRPTQTVYEILWNDNVVSTIFAPPGGDINIILKVVDCHYPDPVPLSAFGGTGYFYTYYNAIIPTFASAASDPGQTTSSAQSIISVTAWFEVEDFTCGQEPTEGVWLQYYDGEGEDREPDGDPIEIELE